MPVSRELPPIVVRIAKAVADARGETAEALVPLSTYFDPEALETFIDSTNAPARIAIELEDCTVVIDHEGRITVGPKSFP